MRQRNNNIKIFIALVIIAVIMVAAVVAMKIAENGEKSTTGGSVQDSTTESTTVETTTPEPTTEETTTPEPKPESYMIEDVPFYLQMEIAKNGCESVAAVMALQYAGIDISAKQFIDKYLDIKKTYRNDAGQTISHSPEKYFINSPYADNGWYCYEKVIYNAICKFLDTDKYAIVDLTGTDLETIENDYICKDIPVIMWTTLWMKPLAESKVTWIIEETGEKYVPYKNSHCMVLVGYDDEKYYFHDALIASYYGYGRSSVESVYEQTGMRALAVYKK